MDVVARYINVQCADCANAYELFPSYIDEYDDSIEIRTGVYNNELHRGWVGDLTYYGVGSTIQNENEKANTNRHTFKDVILQNITIWQCEPDSCVMWKYTFLKK